MIALLQVEMVKKVQSRVIRDRLLKEAESNVAIKVSDTPGGEAFEVAGRMNCKWVF